MDLRPLLPLMVTFVEPPRRGRPARHPVEALRTRLWFHVVKMRSGLNSAYALERFFDGDLIKREQGQIHRPRKWDAYEKGAKSPAGMQGKRNAVEMAEERFPGTAAWFHHPIWQAITAAHMTQEDVDAGMLALGIEVVELLYHRPELHEGRRLQQRQLDEPHLRCLGQHGTFDALAAAVLLVRQSDLIGSPELREWALACYGQLQPQVAVLPEVEPFFADLYSAIDKACPHWVFAAPNQRLSMTMFWQAMPWYQRYQAERESTR